MPPDEKTSVPFLTRKMLSFEHGTKFQLRITFQSNFTSPITIRGATKEGQFIFQAFPAAGDDSFTTLNFQIPDIPIWVTLSDDASAYSEGSVFARLSLVTNGDAIHHLISGYVDSSNWLSWPQAHSQRSNPFGRLTTKTITDPAAGAEFSLTVPAKKIWRIRGWYQTLVTDANVANRRVQLRITTGGFVYVTLISPIDQTASLTRKYTGAVFSVGGASNNGTHIQIPFPHDLIVVSGDVIFSETTNKQAGDDWGEGSLFVEEWKKNS